MRYLFFFFSLLPPLWLSAQVNSCNQLQKRASAVLQSNPESALLLLQEISSTCPEQSKSYTFQRLYASAAWFSGNYQLALKGFHHCLELAKDSAQKSAAYNNMAVVYNDIGFLNLAIEQNRLSLALSSDTLSNANTLNNMATLFLKKGEPRTAISYLFKARELYHYSQDSSGIILSAGNLAKAYRQLEKYDSSSMMIEEVLPFKKSSSSADDLLKLNH